MGYDLKQSQTARPLLFLMLDSADHVTGKAGLAPTVTLSKNGGTFAAPAGAVTELSAGWYKVAGNATDTNTTGPLILHATATGADPTDDLFQVIGFDPDAALSTLDAPGVRAAIGLATANLDAQLTAIDDYIDTEIAAIKAVTDQFTAAQAEPTAAPAVNATPLQKIAWMAALVRNKITQTATTQALRNDADSANIASVSVSDDGTTLTRNKWT